MVWFCTVGLSADVVVEEASACWAVGYAGFPVAGEDGAAEAEVGGEACSGGGDGAPPGGVSVTLCVMTIPAAPVPLDDAQRGAVLNAEVARLARDGYTVESNANMQAVLVKVRRMGWFWNTVLVIVTAGLWLIYVIYRALNRKKDTVILTVDQYGNVRRS